MAEGSTCQERWAREQLNLFCGWHSFLALGCPDQVEKFLPSSWSSSERSLGLAAGMLEEVAAFGDWAIASDSHFPCGTREALHEMVVKLQEHKYSAKIGELKIGEALLGAKPVVVDRIAVPELAGRVEMPPWLCKERAAVLRDLDQLRQEEFLWRQVPEPCHRVARGSEDSLAIRLLNSKMAILIPEDELPRDRNGDMLLGGLFCVSKDVDRNRLIFDRRPENATMKRIGQNSRLAPAFLGFC